MDVQAQYDPIVVISSSIGPLGPGPLLPVISIDVLSLLPPIQTPRRQDGCHDKIAKIFGGPGAVGGDHGVRPGKTNNTPVGAEKWHIYPSLGGTGQTNIYVPAGYDSGVFLNDSNSTAFFYYGNSGNGLSGYKDVTLLVQHVANVPNLNPARIGSENGRVRIGTTGGLDGGQINGPNYQHAHIEYFEERACPR